MFRVLEWVGLLAPVAGAALLIAFRRRARTAVACGLIACVIGVAGSAVGLLGRRRSAIDALRSDGGLAGAVESMDAWSTARLVLLGIAGGVLVTAALLDRRGRAIPVGWIGGGAALMVVGIGIHVVEPDLDLGGHGLAVLVDLAMEAVEVGLLGAGLLALCVAVVSGRPGDDGAPEPADLVRRLGVGAWRVVDEIRRTVGR